MSAVSGSLQRIENSLRHVAGFFAAVGGVALLMLAAITVLAVFWRYVLRSPIFGAEDIATMTLTVIVASAVAYGAQWQAHVSVNVISMMAGRKITRITDAVARILNSLTLTFAACALFKKGSCGTACGAVTSNLVIPHQLFYYILVAALGFYACLHLVHFCIGLAHWSGTDPNEMAE